MTYNGSTQSITAVISSGSIYTNVLNGTQDSISLLYANNSKVDAGSYTASITEIIGPDASNYALPSTFSKSWTINKRVLTLTWSSINTFTYDGKYHNVSLTVGNIIASDTVALNESSFTSSSYSMPIDFININSTNIVLNFKQIDASTYYYQLLSFSNPNYAFNIVQNSMTINKATAILSWDTVSNFDYDGAIHTIDCIVTNAKVRDDNGQEDIVNLTLNNNSKISAGSYTASILSISNSNYKLPTTITKAWTISKVNLTSTWIGYESVNYDGLSHTVSLKISGFVNNDQAAVIISNFVSSPTISNCRIVGNDIYLDFIVTDAGDYSFIVNSYNNPNYSFSSTIKDFSIRAISLETSWNGDSSYIYNGEYNIITITLSGFINADETDVSLASLGYLFTKGNTNITPVLSHENGIFKLTFNLKDVGDYLLTVSSIDGNYTLSSPFSQSFSINPKSITASWSNSTTFIYNGENQGMTLTISGIASSDLSSFSSYLTCTGATLCNSTVVGNTIQYSVFGKKCFHV